MKLRRLITPVAAVALFVVCASGSHAVGAAIWLKGGVTLGKEVGCTAAGTKALVQKFVRNYNGGQVAVINRLWASEPYFQWFSTRAPGARLGPRAYDRSTLTAYFRARVRVHERLRLTKLGAGYDRHRKIVNFAGKLVRSADDLRSGPPQDFKGAAGCESGGPILIVWSM
jgi:hypothetical protein